MSGPRGKLYSAIGPSTRLQPTDKIALAIFNDASQGDALSGPKGKLYSATGPSTRLQPTDGDALSTLGEKLCSKVGPSTQHRTVVGDALATPREKLCSATGPPTHYGSQHTAAGKVALASQGHAHAGHAQYSPERKCARRLDLPPGIAPMLMPLAKAPPPLHLAPTPLAQ